MSSIVVSHVPSSVSKEKLENFFSFCGTVSSVLKLLSDDKFASYEVRFASPKALSTALLLNDAELDGIAIQVKENKADGDDLPKYDELTAQTVDDNKVQTDTGDKNYDDIVQEEKPKYAIMAQLLANGYMVGDQIIQRALETDKKNGYSAKFKSFLTGLDDKYVHSQDPELAANKNLSRAQDTLQLLHKKYGPTISSYFEKAANSPYGVKIHDFYQQIANDAQAVYNEAARLVELKKAQASKGSSPAPESTEKN